MFELNDYVFYGSGGVCKIVDVQKAPLDGMPEDKLYYILHSLHDQSSVMYVPVDSDCIFLRRLVSREEAESLLQTIPSVSVIEEPNAKLLREKYNLAMKAHLPIEWVRVIKTVYARMNDPKMPSRKISETERSFAENAKKYLHMELSIVLETELKKIEQDVLACIRANG